MNCTLAICCLSGFVSRKNWDLAVEVVLSGKQAHIPPMYHGIDG